MKETELNFQNDVRLLIIANSTKKFASRHYKFNASVDIQYFVEKTIFYCFRIPRPKNLAKYL